jgi:hypothetical protein
LKLVPRLTSQLKKKGVKNASAVALALLKKRGDVDSSGNLTAHGKTQQKLGAAGRAKKRAVKYQGGKASDYAYNSKTNLTHRKK